MSSRDTLRFGRRNIDTASPVLVIAEIGINHEGNVDLCASMIESASRAGADSVKLQTIDADANYCLGTESHDLFKMSALSPEETSRMFDLARSLGMEIFTTVGDPNTLEWVENLDPVAYKASSGLNNHTFMLERLMETGKPLLISTGMASIEDIDASVSLVKDAPGGYGIFHCTSLYPAPPETLNLSMIPWLKERYGAAIGFSDHSIGVEAASLSVAAGSVMIEKHFSFDTTRPGYDHPISVDETGLAQMIEGIRTAERMRGTAPKVLTQAEQDVAKRSHRVLVALQDLSPGDSLTEKSLGFKRPLPGVEGISPSGYNEFLKRKASTAIMKDQAITYSNTRP